MLIGSQKKAGWEDNTLTAKGEELDGKPRFKASGPLYSPVPPFSKRANYLMSTVVQGVRISDTKGKNPETWSPFNKNHKLTCCEIHEEKFSWKSKNSTNKISSVLHPYVQHNLNRSIWVQCNLKTQMMCTWLEDGDTCITAGVWLFPPYIHILSQSLSLSTGQFSTGTPCF